jgi:hypothetical protein
MKLLQWSKHPTLTSPGVTLPDSVGRYFLSGHRRLSEEHSPNRDVAPPEANPRSQFHKANKSKQGLFQEGSYETHRYSDVVVFLCVSCIGDDFQGTAPDGASCSLFGSPGNRLPTLTSLWVRPKIAPSLFP